MTSETTVKKKKGTNCVGFLVLGILTLCIAAGVFFFQKAAPYKKPGGSASVNTPATPSVSTENSTDAELKIKKYWSDRMDAVGAARAYQEFVAAAPRNPLAAHQTTHTIGALLYEKLEWTGIALCDQRYTYACYHGFLKQALGSLGLEALTRAWQVCPQKNTWERDAVCLHGIGHGILSFVGRENLDKALSLCEGVHKRHGLPGKNISGCFSGVFMEYHFWNTHEEFISPLDLPKSAADDELHKPCATLPHRYRAACYFEQPDWWKEVLNRDYKYIGSLCEALTSQQEKDACFFGLGFTLSRELDEGLEQTRSVCAAIQNADIQKNCRIGTAWFYFRVPGRQEWAVALCNKLASAERGRCLNPQLE